MWLKWRWQQLKHARNYTDDVEFSCEDAGRTGIDNICRIVEAAIMQVQQL